MGDDCLYEEKHETTLKTLYRNGFTVVSDQNLNRKKIKNTIFKTFQLPIAKIQFIDENSTLIGYREKILRYSILITIVVFSLVAIAVVKRW